MMAIIAPCLLLGKTVARVVQADALFLAMTHGLGFTRIRYCLIARMSEHVWAMATEIECGKWSRRASRLPRPWCAEAARLDEYVVIPDHLHGILVTEDIAGKDDGDRGGTGRRADCIPGLDEDGEDCIAVASPLRL